LDVVRKITLNDLININRKDTDVVADVLEGDLIKVQLDEKELFGIVVSVDTKSMELQTPEGQIRWVSRYVIYEKIQ
tara:strand:- start:410 stop:637 length:228 start_codon:yes stop_codon:yes gene_type:complete